MYLLMAKCYRGIRPGCRAHQTTSGVEAGVLASSGGSRKVLEGIVFTMRTRRKLQRDNVLGKENNA